MAINEFSKLKPQHQIFVNEVAKGVSRVEAYQKAYPNTGYNTAKVNGSKLLTNTNLANAVKLRIQRALDNQKVTPEEVIGHAVRQMRSSMDDVLNESGKIDLNKARETGAIDHIKKYKKTVNYTENGTTETTEVELMTNESARKELANYMGIERFSGEAGLAESPFLPVFIDIARSLLAELPDANEAKRQALELMRIDSTPEELAELDAIDVEAVIL